jgi:nucleoid-associated protein YgaU
VDEGLRELGRDLWRDKPILLTVVVALAAMVYILIHRSQSAGAPMPAPDVAGTAGGTFITYDYYAPVSTAAPPIAPPVAPGPVSPPSPPPGPPKSGTPKQRTVVVTKWPSLHSTLWGIATDYYQSGPQWPRIYEANRSLIGPDPNKLRVGMVLVVP